VNSYAQKQKQRANERYIARFVARGRGPLAMYDIGVGPKTEWATLGAVWPGMRLFGCEPHPGQYEFLIRNGWPGVLANVAIGQPEGIRRLHTHPTQMCSSLVVPRGGDTVDVKVWSLDRFDQQMGRPGRILLWMDIEGGELEALASGPELLSSGRVRWINIEERKPGRVPEGWPDPKEIHGLLDGYGYRREKAYNHHPTHHDVIYRHKDE